MLSNDENTTFEQRSARLAQDHCENDELLTVREVAAFLKVPASWIYERTRRRGLEKLPHLKLGKYLRFSKSEVVNWLLHQR